MSCFGTGRSNSHGWIHSRRGVLAGRESLRRFSVFNSSETVFALSSGHGKCGN